MWGSHSPGCFPEDKGRGAERLPFLFSFLVLPWHNFRNMQNGYAKSARPQTEEERKGSDPIDRVRSCRVTMNTASTCTACTACSTCTASITWGCSGHSDEAGWCTASLQYEAFSPEVWGGDVSANMAETSLDEALRALEGLWCYKVGSLRASDFATATTERTAHRGCPFYSQAVGEAFLIREIRRLSTAADLYPPLPRLVREKKGRVEPKGSPSFFRFLFCLGITFAICKTAVPSLQDPKLKRRERGSHRQSTILQSYHEDLYLHEHCCFDDGVSRSWISPSVHRVWWTQRGKASRRRAQEVRPILGGTRPKHRS